MNKYITQLSSLKTAKMAGKRAPHKPILLLSIIDLVCASLSILVTNGRLNAGIWQGIYLCEFRNRGGRRNIVATIIGE